MTTHSVTPESRPPEAPHQGPVPFDLHSSAPRVLIVATRRWFSAARLAMAFAAAGAQVELLSPPGHPALLTHAIDRHHPFRALRPLRSIANAIQASGPDLVIPTDDTAVGYLHRLYSEAHRLNSELAPALRALLARSLGDPARFPLLESRTCLLTAAQKEDILAPATELVPDKSSLRDWLARNPLPAVLKADGTSGGEGVEIVNTRKQAFRAWSRLRAPLGLARAAQKACLEHDANHLLPWFTRRPRQVSIQPFIQGHDANMAVACWQGELLGAITLDVLHTWRPKGPSVLVELTQNDAMLVAARALIARLHLSGFYGFDFIVENTPPGQPWVAPRAWLIEINARATQTCHLPYGAPRDLVPALLSALTSRPLPAANNAPQRGVIALFPLAWQAGLTTQMLDSTIQDIPYDEPLLAMAGLALPRESAYEKWKKLWRRAPAPNSLPGESQ